MPVNGFKWIKKLSKFNEEFIKNYDKTSNKGHILEVDVEYPKNLFNLHSDLPLLAERKKIDQCNKLAWSKYDIYVVHIRALKQALTHGLMQKKSIL